MAIHYWQIYINFVRYIMPESFLRYKKTSLLTYFQNIIMLKKFLIVMILLAGSSAAGFAQSKGGDLFPVPTVPSDLTSLQDRSDYVIGHYWDHCNVKSILSSQKKFTEAFDTYVNLLPLGTRRTVIRSIYNLLSQLEKNPKELLFVAELAESQLYSDTAKVKSDEAYIPFARAVAENKKIGRAEKARYAEQVRIIMDSNIGMPAPALEFTDAEGMRSTLKEASDTASYTILYFNDPDCVDCIIARGRLAANHTVNDLIGKGLLKVVAITPDEPTDEWRSQAARYPTNWTVGAAPDAPSIYDIRSTPTFYILDREHKIVSKDTPIDDIIRLFNNMM